MNDVNEALHREYAALTCEAALAFWWSMHAEWWAAERPTRRKERAAAPETRTMRSA